MSSNNYSYVVISESVKIEWEMIMKMINKMR